MAKSGQAINLFANMQKPVKKTETKPETVEKKKEEPASEPLQNITEVIEEPVKKAETPQKPKDKKTPQKVKASADDQKLRINLTLSKSVIDEIDKITKLYKGGRSGYIESLILKDLEDNNDYYNKFTSLMSEMKK